MKYLLDTNTCVRFINGRSPQLRDKFLKMPDAQVVVSAITKAEMFYGSAKSQTPAISRVKQDTFLNNFVSLPFDDKAAEVYGPLRANLQQFGKVIGPLDMLIAAIALANDLILVDAQHSGIRSCLRPENRRLGSVIRVQPIFKSGYCGGFWLPGGPTAHRAIIGEAT